MSATLSKSKYVAVWLALMALLFLTWGVAKFDLGIANVIIALAISLMKMLLVILFFMQVRHSSKLTWLFAAAGFVWFLIMITLTFTDYLTRHTVTPYEREKPAPAEKLQTTGHLNPSYESNPQ